MSVRKLLNSMTPFYGDGWALMLSGISIGFVIGTWLFL